MDILLDLLNYFPVTLANSLLILLLSPSVDSQQGTSCRNKLIHDVEGFFLSLENTNFAENWNFNVFCQGLDDLIN